MAALMRLSYGRFHFTVIPVLPAVGTATAVNTVYCDCSITNTKCTSSSEIPMYFCSL